jgi:hypothetical protein
MKGIYKRDDIINDLRDHVAEVTFKQVNGEMRSLRVTLMPNHLPANFNADHLEAMHQKEENLHTIAAWDIRTGGWKSFLVDNVQYVQILDNF